MAALIPQDENEPVLELKSPKDEEQIGKCLFTGSTDSAVWSSVDKAYNPSIRIIHWYTPDGASWWGLNYQFPPGPYQEGMYPDKNLFLPNPANVFLMNARATQFNAAQGLQGLRNAARGNILYLSPEETRIYMRFKEILVPVFGDTFPVKDRLKAMGAWWDAGARLWLVPTHLLSTAQGIVRRSL